MLHQADFNISNLTEERFDKTQDRTAKQQGLGSTDAGLAVCAKYIADTTAYVLTLKVPTEIVLIEPEIIALMALQVGISCVARAPKVSQAMYFLGSVAENEVFAAKVKLRSSSDKKALDRLAKSICKNHASPKARMAALRSASQKAGLARTTEWDKQLQAKIGLWLIDVCLATPVFVRIDMPDPADSYIAMTTEALAHADGVINALLMARPVMLPLLTQPEPWTDSTIVIDGYKHRLVRKNDKVIQAHIREGIRSGSMAPVLEAVNAIQNTPFKINKFILEMIEWSYANGVMIEGFPRINDLPQPERPIEWDLLTTDQQKVWKKTSSDVAKANRSNSNDRLTLTQDLAVADYIGDNTFWIPNFLDYRGRVYAITHFNFQRGDHIRALFLFDEGKPLDADGLYWLKVHLANCGDFQKISKQSFDARVAWADANLDLLQAIAEDPRGNTVWATADKPFLFLAACRALADHLKDPSTLISVPVSFDGSCSGLQHLAAMTRDEATARLVNLMDTLAPGDIYKTVADKALVSITADLSNPEFSEVAAKCIAYGVNRSLVKRNVMTYSYSSNKFGMGEQHMEDTMKPLAFEVLKGTITQHPFEVADDTTTKDGKTWTTPGRTASIYLANKVHAAIEETVKRPAKAMKFLISLARITANEGKPLIWHTPLGLPVVHRYPVMTSKCITLYLHDRGVTTKFQPRMQEEGKGIDKKKAANAAAPNFVHSMDACHLMQVVRESNTQGITSVALVHDSFGCLPTDAAKFRCVIGSTFKWLYDKDILNNIRDEVLGQLDTSGHRMQDLPEYGSYNIEDILKATYAFS